jgi:hypothetical protein
MAFGRLANRHDLWLAFCDHNRALLAEVGLPEAIARSESLFRDLLRGGAATGRGARAALRELSPVQWAALARFATVFFREFESYAPLDLVPAYRLEAERRSDAAETAPDPAG